MSDNVTLKIGGKVLENPISYSIEADIYTADDAFSIEVIDPQIRIDEGKKFELFVNERKEMVGIIDRIEHSYSKSGSNLRIEGRDLCGLLTDTYCEQPFEDIEDMTCKDLAERLLKNVPFIKRSNLSYQDSIWGNRKGDASSLDTPQNFGKIMPGQTIFEVLKTYAESRGMMFFFMPEGKFVFGRPKIGGKPLYHLVMRTGDPKENNILEGTCIRDISRRYSKITVIGQQQGMDDYGADEINTEDAVTDSGFPFDKPYVTTDNNDSLSPKQRARMIMEQMKFEGFQLRYRVAGHSQHGRNYRINEMSHVVDEVAGLEGDYLIYGRTFERSKQGTFTTLRLSYPGVIQ